MLRRLKVTRFLKQVLFRLSLRPRQSLPQWSPLFCLVLRLSHKCRWFRKPLPFPRLFRVLEWRVLMLVIQLTTSQLLQLVRLHLQPPQLPLQKQTCSSGSRSLAVSRVELLKLKNKMPWAQPVSTFKQLRIVMAAHVKNLLIKSLT